MASAAKSGRRAAARLSRLSLSWSGLPEQPVHQSFAKIELRTRTCKGQWSELYCPNEEAPGTGHTFRTVWRDGNKSPDCEKCVGAYGSMRAKRLWESKGLEYLTAWPWWVFVLPLPAPYRSQAGPRECRRLRELLLAKLERFIRERRLADIDPLEWTMNLGMIAVWHPEGDEEPGVWKPHLNVICPCVAYGAWKDDNGITWAWKALKPFWTPRDLVNLRKLFAEALESVFGYAPPVDAKDGNVRTDVHVEYRGGPPTRKLDAKSQLAKQKHCLRYNLRSFPGWPVWTRRIHATGFLADSKIGAAKTHWNELTPVPWAEPLECELCKCELHWRPLEPGADREAEHYSEEDFERPRSP